MDTETLAYLAGILDGEGCLSLGVRKKIYVTPTVQVTNTDKRLIDWLDSCIPGHIYSTKEIRPNRKKAWLWSIAGAKARELIRSVRPFLKLKGEQADIILQLATIDRRLIPRSTRTGRLMRLPPEYHQKVAHAVILIRALNRRGPR